MYRNNQNLINPNNLKRSNKSYHIDHIFSIKQGFLINLPVEIVSHPCNLHMIHYKENLIKQDNCWIELNELLRKIISYEQELTFTHEHLRNKYSKVKEISENIVSNHKASSKWLQNRALIPETRSIFWNRLWLLQVSAEFFFDADGACFFQALSLSNFLGLNVQINMDLKKTMSFMVFTLLSLLTKV